ncbi:hypothetical protein EI74_0187 [Mycoplasma testudineum]|uniref:Uncharacterized protein n=1 Tax=Mycoplasma testudineum TaxID=244584 RepID=A0A4R6IGZ4_9MOLU|nr:hypothetical protein [Mycoplasma testudineum]OYD27091.1 hypothetical protein CG473_00350 [Mycoplasma testudineum]TDO21156.1 hypothetical protein EI74_0187 [Mycoplasma testudineum]
MSEQEQSKIRYLQRRVKQDHRLIRAGTIVWSLCIAIFISAIVSLSFYISAAVNSYSASNNSVVIIDGSDINPINLSNSRFYLSIIFFAASVATSIIFSSAGAIIEIITSVNIARYEKFEIRALLIWAILSIFFWFLFFPWILLHVKFSKIRKEILSIPLG